MHAVATTLPDGQRIRVALRRGEDGELFTQVLGEGSVDLSDPAVAAAVDAPRTRSGTPSGSPDECRTTL